MARISKERKMINTLTLNIVMAWDEYQLGSINATAYNRIRNDNLTFASIYFDKYNVVAESFKRQTGRDCLPE